MSHTLTRITALQAQAAANGFLNDCPPDRFTADEPTFDSIRNEWRVTVIAVYPFVGSIGKVGEVASTRTPKPSNGIHGLTT